MMTSQSLTAEDRGNKLGELQASRLERTVVEQTPEL